MQASGEMSGVRSGWVPVPDRTRWSNRNRDRGADRHVPQKLHPSGNAGKANSCNKRRSNCAEILWYAHGDGIASDAEPRRAPKDRRQENSRFGRSVLFWNRLHAACSTSSFPLHRCEAGGSVPKALPADLCAAVSKILCTAGFLSSSVADFFVFVK